MFHFLGFSFIIFFLLNSGRAKSGENLYQEDGSPALLLSPECRSLQKSRLTTSSVAGRCHTAVSQGKDALAGISALFGEHNVAAACEMALEPKEQSINDSKYEFAPGLQKNSHALSFTADISSDPLQLKRDEPFATMLKRLLVENLNDNEGNYASQGNSAFRRFSYEKDWHLQSRTAIIQNQDQSSNPESFSTSLWLHDTVLVRDFCLNNRYVLKKRLGRGGFGEVWLALRQNCYQGNKATSWIKQEKNIHINEHTDCIACNASTVYDVDGYDNPFILKRIMAERGPAFFLSGLREKHFGELFQTAYDNATQTSSPRPESSVLDLSEESLKHIARYIEYLGSQEKDLWLVFHHEGVSLSKLMYSAGEAEARYNQMVHPSKWWTWLKTTESGKDEMRNIIWQLLLGLKACHDRNITHRDIKPGNMVICFEDQKTGRCVKKVPKTDQSHKTIVRIIDFGGSIDEFTMKHLLHGLVGPSSAEQSQGYAPPEAILNGSWYRVPATVRMKYDIWSVGVVALEMILGSPNVFEISSVTRALLDREILGWRDNWKELIYKLQSLMDLCILTSGNALKRSDALKKQDSLAPWKCTEEQFGKEIKSRDPLKIGFPSVLALRLVRGLLQWYPEDRLSVDEALRHPYFHSSGS